MVRSGVIAHQKYFGGRPNVAIEISRLDVAGINAKVNAKHNLDY